MAVVPRKRKNSTTYYVATSFKKKVYYERSGTDRREAERLDGQRRREVKAGAFEPSKVTDTWTVAEYAKQWGDARTNISASDDRRNLARFTALPELGPMNMVDVRPRHIIAALKQLGKGAIGQKTIQNAYGSLNTMFRDAVIADDVVSNPCVLPRGFFSDDDAKEREPYTRTETALLVSHASIPWPIRVLNALCLLGGMREGEACGRRWVDLDMAPEPLWALDIATQYGGRQLKTKKRRVLPVHPDLQRILEQWGAVGFVELMGRAPTPEDYIVPKVGPRSQKPHHTKSTFYKAFVAGCAAIGIPNKTLHSTRHTMITLARRGRADKAVLSKVTHNAKGDIVDRYTHRDWLELCEAVLSIGSLFDVRPNLHLGSGNPQEGGGSRESSLAANSRALPPRSDTGPSSIPGASTQNQHKTSLSSEPRLRARQSDPAGSRGNVDAGEVDSEAEDFEIALGEFAARGQETELLAKPLAKAKAVPYVARKRGVRL